MDGFQLNIETLLFRRKFEESNSLEEKLALCKNFVKKFETVKEDELDVQFPDPRTYQVTPHYIEMAPHTYYDQYNNRIEYYDYVRRDGITKYSDFLEQYIICEVENDISRNSQKVMTTFKLDKFISANVRRRRYEIR